MLKTITLDTKSDLINFRKDLVNKKGSVCRLLYRAGKYVLTYSTMTLTNEDLVMMGFKKARKQTKDDKVLQNNIK